MRVVANRHLATAFVNPDMVVGKKHQLWIRRKRAFDDLELVRRPEIVAIEHADDIAGRFLDAPQGGEERPAVAAHPKIPDLLGVGFCDLGGRVGAAIVDDDYFISLPALGENRIYGLAE